MPNLSVLNLAANIICEAKSYRWTVLRRLATLDTFDGVPVTNEEKVSPPSPAVWTPDVGASDVSVDLRVGGGLTSKYGARGGRLSGDSNLHQPPGAGGRAGGAASGQPPPPRPEILPDAVRRACRPQAEEVMRSCCSDGAFCSAFHTSIGLIPPSHSVFKSCAFEWVQSSGSWGVVVLNGVGLPKVSLSSPELAPPPPPPPARLHCLHLSALVRVQCQNNGT